MIESELNQRFKFILKGTPEANGAIDVSPFFGVFHQCCQSLRRKLTMPFIVREKRDDSETIREQGAG